MGASSNPNEAEAQFALLSLGGTPSIFIAEESSSMHMLLFCHLGKFFTLSYSYIIRSTSWDRRLSISLTELSLDSSLPYKISYSGSSSSSDVPLSHPTLELNVNDFLLLKFETNGRCFYRKYV